jgi:hypothetical protein
LSIRTNPDVDVSDIDVDVSDIKEAASVARQCRATEAAKNEKRDAVKGNMRQ